VNSEEKLRQVFESVTDGISVIDLEGIITEANQRAIEMHGFSSRNELLGKSLFELLAPHEHERIETNLKKASKEGAVDGIEYTLTRANGSEFPGELSINILKDAQGNVSGHIVIARDITEQKKQNERLMSTDRLASLGELAAGTAHEFNNPLTSIIVLSEMLMEKGPDGIRDDLTLINNEARRAANVARNLLAFGGKHTPVKQLYQVNSVIEDVLELRAYEHKSSNIDIERHLAADLPELMVDYFQMQQVFMNIIINAEYFMMDAHGRGTLAITTQKENGIVRMSFADDGPGITPENLKRIFDPFFTTKEAGKGTGLGLSICHSIVADHGGQIYVRSELGKGTTILVELPIESRARNNSSL
jgi:two-component system NtrC family sensor kinase